MPCAPVVIHALTGACQKRFGLVGRATCRRATITRNGSAVIGRKAWLPPDAVPSCRVIGEDRGTALNRLMPARASCACKIQGGEVVVATAHATIDDHRVGCTLRFASTSPKWCEGSRRCRGGGKDNWACHASVPSNSRNRLTPPSGKMFRRTWVTGPKSGDLCRRRMSCTWRRLKV